MFLLSLYSVPSRGSVIKLLYSPHKTQLVSAYTNGECVIVVMRACANVDIIRPFLQAGLRTEERVVMRNSQSQALNRIIEPFPLPPACHLGPPLEAKTLSFSGMKIEIRSPKAGPPEAVFGIIPGVVEGLRLSNREIEIIQCLIREQKDLAIAQELGISYNTLRTQLSRLYRKLGVHSRTGVVVAVLGEVIRRMGEETTIGSKK